MTDTMRTTPANGAALALLLLAAPALRAQATPDVAAPGRRLSIHVPTGAFVPTGAQADAVRGAQLSAVQVAWALRPDLAIVGTFGWMHSRREDLATAATPRLDVLTADLGVERRLLARGAARRVGVSAFAGAGAGARRYDQRGPGIEAVNAVAGYVSAGGEVRLHRVALRLEARDYVGAGAALPGAGARGTAIRNDIVVMAGLRLAGRR